MTRCLFRKSGTSRGAPRGHGPLLQGTPVHSAVVGAGHAREGIGLAVYL